MTDSTVSDNTATESGGGADTPEGGGIYSYGGSFSVASSTVSGNTATESGGGIGIDGTLTFTIADSTLAGNTSTDGVGGAIANYDGGVTLTDSTVSGNTAPVGGGSGIYNGGTTTLAATIVANSGTGLDCNTEGMPTDAGYNVADDGSCGFSAANHSLSDSTTLDLGSLANNGGPTETILPDDTSSAVGVIPSGTTLNSVEICPRVDQRGVASSGSCSVGAVEVTAPAAGAGGLTALTPARILDTRNGTGGISGPVASDHSISLNVEGVGGVPASGVSAVVLNVTATAPSANGHLTVYPDGASVPSTSNLNFSAGETVPNLVIAPVGSDGKVDFYNGSGGTVQVLADVSGWFASGSAAAGGLTALTPARILDTRNGTGGISGPVASDHSISLNVEGVGGVPASGVSAVVLNVTATAPSANGHLTVYPDGASVPSTSNLNFSAGETVPNLVIAPVGSDGKVDFYNGSGGTVQVLADVSGWFASGSAAAGGLTALTPARILDTRNGTGGISGPVASDHSISLNVEGVGGVPASGVGAVVLNVTATAPSANGHLTVYPDGASVPSTSNLNFSAGETVPNLVIAPVGSDGKVDFYNGSGGTVQVLADVSGWFSGTSASTAVKQVASDGQGFCAVLFAGGLDCWGVNDEGELGNGTFSGPDGEAGYDTPQAVTGITNAVSATSNNAGLGYCALLSTGRVDCWGDNTWGEIGNGTTVGEYDTPQAVTGITNAVSVVSGGQGYDYCAVLSTGGVDCWGLNSEGELGDGNIGGPDGLNDGYDTPQAVVGITKAISLSGDGTGDGGYCAVLSTGGVDCWGANTFGELGNGTTGGPDVGPVRVYGYDTPQAVTGITNAVSVTSNASSEGYCAVLSTGGVDCWGDNTYGEIGNGTFSDQNGGGGAPDGEGGYDTPQAVTGITNAVSVTTDSNVFDSLGYCAVLSTGGVDCWGDNNDGVLGNGTIGGTDEYLFNAAGYDTPQAVTGITNAASVNGEGLGSYCAVLSTGGVDCWGVNGEGGLGNGTTGGPDGADGYDTPQAVTGITNAVSVVSEGITDHSDQTYCATISTGTVECWGYNPDGQLGNGAIDGPDGEYGYDTPQEVSVP